MPRKSVQPKKFASATYQAKCNCTVDLGGATHRYLKAGQRVTVAKKVDCKHLKVVEIQYDEPELSLDDLDESIDDAVNEL